MSSKVRRAMDGNEAAAYASYTASQGLMLMIPTMYRIAGQLKPGVIHVASRNVATHAISINAEQSDVMACRRYSGSGDVQGSSMLSLMQRSVRKQPGESSVQPYLPHASGKRPFSPGLRRSGQILLWCGMGLRYTERNPRSFYLLFSLH